MKRKKPDRLSFATWAAAHLAFGDRREWRADGLWKHWSDFARKAGVDRGSRRSFSNELRKIGCPWLRSKPGCRSRYHHGASLVIPRIFLDPNHGYLAGEDESLRAMAEFNLNMYQQVAYE